MPIFTLIIERTFIYLKSKTNWNGSRRSGSLVLLLQKQAAKLGFHRVVVVALGN